MNSNHQRTLKAISVLGSLAIIIVSIGFGCGEGFRSSNYSESSLGTDVPIGGGEVPDNGSLEVVVGSKTVAITNFKAALDNMVAMAGVTPSNTTLTAFNNNVGSFSETGSVLSINAPMLMAYIAVGSEVCNDLLGQENGITPAANRRFFGQLDFAATNATAIRDADLSDTVIPNGVSDAVRRLARQFWQRNESAAELAAVNAGVQEILTATPALPTANIQRRAALYICSAMIASTAGYQL